MVGKKIKGSKKAVLGSPLDAPSITEQFRTWTEEHSSFLVGGAVALLLVVVIVWGVRMYGDSKERRARVDYVKAMEKWPAEGETKNLELVVPELERFIRDHQGTAPALDAHLDLARAYFQLQRYEDALKWSGKVLADLSGDHELRPLALYQVAQTYEALGKADEAILQWNALKAMGLSGLEREASWHLARLYAKKQESAKALEEYERAASAAGMYPSKAQLQEELAAAKAGAGQQGKAPEPAKGS